MTYRGGKGNCYHQIINQIPPHEVYIEAFLGGASVLRQKRPSRLTIGLDLDPAVIEAITVSGDTEGEFYCVDAVDYLAQYHFAGVEFVYCDPPYVMSSRRYQRPYYQFEYSTEDHIRLLSLLLTLPCPVAISGYWSELYADMLAGWRLVQFTTPTRGKVATESLWMNYPEPIALHDYRFLGADFRERERIKKRKARWVNRLATMGTLERRAILWAIQEMSSPEMAMGAAIAINGGAS